MSRPTLTALAPLLFAAVLLPSCKTTDTSTTSDPYVTNEDGYNPYPGSSGGGNSQSLLPPSAGGSASYVPQYDQAVPAPPSGFEVPGDSGSFQSAPAPKPRTPSTNSVSSKPKSTPTSTKPRSTTTTKPKAKPKATPPKKPVTSKVHTVVSGDTLYGLALKNKTTVAKIKALNGLTSDKLSIGKKLKMP
jgi:LysM repeat protein